MTTATADAPTLTLLTCRFDQLFDADLLPPKADISEDVTTDGKGVKSVTDIVTLALPPDAANEIMDADPGSYEVWDATSEAWWTVWVQAPHAKGKYPRSAMPTDAEDCPEEDRPAVIARVHAARMVRALAEANADTFTPADLGELEPTDDNGGSEESDPGDGGAPEGAAIEVVGFGVRVDLKPGIPAGTPLNATDDGLLMAVLVLHPDVAAALEAAKERQDLDFEGTAPDLRTGADWEITLGQDAAGRIDFYGNPGEPSPMHAPHTEGSVGRIRAAIFQGNHEPIPAGTVRAQNGDAFLDLDADQFAVLADVPFEGEEEHVGIIDRTTGARWRVTRYNGADGLAFRAVPQHAGGAADAAGEPSVPPPVPGSVRHPALDLVAAREHYAAAIEEGEDDNALLSLVASNIAIAGIMLGDRQW